MRCVCGQELVDEGVHACPACGAVADPAGIADEGIEVDGRRLPIRVWEGEVLLRGVAWTAGLHAASLDASFAVHYLRYRIGPASTIEAVVGILLVAGLALRFARLASRWMAVCAVLGCAMLAIILAEAETGTESAISLGALGAFVVSLAIPGRSRVARNLLTILCAVWLAFLLLEAGPFLLRPSLSFWWFAMALWTLPPLFCLAAMWCVQGRAAMNVEYRGQPLASLSSVCHHAFSPLGWASIGFVALSWLIALLWLAYGMGWLR